MKTRKVILEGKGTVSLTDSDYLSTGGEGTLYKKGPVVIKIFLDPLKSQDIRDKMKKFIQLKHEFIAAPEGLVLNSKADPIGCFMPFVAGSPMSLLFTNAFRQRENFDDAAASKVVDRMRETVLFAHAHQAFLTDNNELNTIVAVKDRKPLAIDVDGWQFEGSIPAVVAKMPSIRDFFSPSVSQASDWYAFAVVIFQLYCGVHPFKGHLDGYKATEMERRMKDHASVFAKGVRLNTAVRDFSSIPVKLLEWLRIVFSSKDRSIPPSPFEVGKLAPATIQVLRTVTTATGALKYEKLWSSTIDQATRIFPCGIVLTDSLELISLATSLSIGHAESADCELVRVEDGWLTCEEGRFSYLQEGGTQVDLPMMFGGTKSMTVGNRMFLMTPQGLTEIQFMFMGRPLVATGSTWGFLENSTRWFEGIGVQDAFGATHLILPFDGFSCTHLRVPELDGLTPVNAKAGHRFASVIAVDKKGQYQKFELAINSDYTSYKLWQGSAATPDLSLAILPKGVTATIVDDGELIIMVPTSGVTKKVLDKGIRTDLELARWENAVVYIRDGQVWKMSLT